MTKAKKTSKRDSLENILVEGEDVLWQGKPHASLLEYLREKPTAYTPGELFKIQWALITRNQSVKVPESCSWGCLMNAGMFLGAMASMGLFTIVTIVLPFSLGEFLPDWLEFIILMIVAPIVAIVAIFLVPPLFSYSVFFIQKLVVGIFEKRFIRYAITNERIIIITNQWFYDFLHHFAVRGVVIEDGQHGATVSWLGVSEEETPIDRFLGLSEFDVSHLIEIVKSRSSLVVEIEDKRESKAST